MPRQSIVEFIKLAGVCLAPNRYVRVLDERLAFPVPQERFYIPNSIFSSFSRDSVVPRYSEGFQTVC